MTHLSRSDSDKMFSDMAEEGSADDYGPDYGPNEYDTDMSGSGDDRKYLMNRMTLFYLFSKIFFILLSFDTKFMHK
jgi:hypothetical protein